MRIIPIRFALLASLLTSPLLAQTTARWGVVAGLGIGVGAADVHCATCSGGDIGGPSMNARLGGALREDLMLVAELDAFSGSKYVNFATNSSSLEALNVVALWYPRGPGGYFVSAGLGGGRVGSSSGRLFSGYQSPIGPAYKVGVGYDIKVGASLAITPFTSFVYVAGGTPKGMTEKLSGSVIVAGVSANFNTMH